VPLVFSASLAADDGAVTAVLLDAAAALLELNDDIDAIDTATATCSS